MSSSAWRRMAARVRRIRPLRLLILGYALYIAATWLALTIPLCQAQPVRPIDNLFTAASAVSTTGLVTVNTPVAYTLFGELVILIAFQIGGLGYMTLGSFIVLSRRDDLSVTRERVGRLVFTLPEDFDLRQFLRHVVVFTFSVEIAGAAGLWFAFRSAGLEHALWPALFHSVSAFCTAGFSVFPDSLESFRGNAWVNILVGALSVMGAVGFLVASDLWLTLSGRRRRTTLTTRIILHMTLWLILTGWALLFLVEPAFGALPAHERLLASGFQAMTALTTVGFDTHAIGTLGHASTLVLVVLMVLGASPAGTGGGLKSTSVSAALAVLWSTLRGRSEVTFWGARVPSHRLFAAYAALVFYIVTLFGGTLLLLLVQTQPFDDVLFEAASGLGTVGLSRGITADLTPLGKLIVTGLMFVGRLGPLTFGLALFAMRPRAQEPGEQDLVVS